MKVLKVGGSCLAGPRDYAGLAARARAEGARVLVVSALQGVTDALVALVAGQAGAPTSAELGRRHLALLEGTDAEARASAATSLATLAEELETRLRGLVPGTADPWEVDAVLGLGERMSLVVARAHVPGPVRAHVAEEAGVLTTAEPGAARVLERGATLVRDRLGGHTEGLDLVAGYVGRSEDGRWTTLGRGGSDVTAAFLAWALGGDAVLLKDTPGLLSADPRLVPAARLLPALDPAHALILARSGAQIVAPAALELCQRHGLTLRVRPWRGEGPGTVIGAGQGTSARALAVGPAPGDAAAALLTWVGHGVETLASHGRDTLRGLGIKTLVHSPREAGVLRIQVPASSALEAARALHSLWAA